jgi:hypothetical protein
LGEKKSSPTSIYNVKISELKEVLKLSDGVRYVYKLNGDLPVLKSYVPVSVFLKGINNN